MIKILLLATLIFTTLHTPESAQANNSELFEQLFPDAARKRNQRNRRLRQRQQRRAPRRQRRRLRRQERRQRAAAARERRLYERRQRQYEREQAAAQREWERQQRKEERQRIQRQREYDKQRREEEKAYAERLRKQEAAARKREMYQDAERKRAVRRAKEVENRKPIVEQESKGGGTAIVAKEKKEEEYQFVLKPKKKTEAKTPAVEIDANIASSILELDLSGSAVAAVPAVIAPVNDSGSKLVFSPSFTSGGDMIVREGRALYHWNAEDKSMKKIRDIVHSSFNMVVIKGDTEYKLIVREGKKMYQLIPESNTWKKVAEVQEYPANLAVIGNNLVVMSKGKLWHRKNEGWHQFGDIDGAVTSSLITVGDSLVLRTKKKIHRWNSKTEEWSVMGKVSEEPFSMAALGPILVTREGGTIYQWNSKTGAWGDKDAGVVYQNGSPFVMKAVGTEMVVREGGRLTKWNPERTKPWQLIEEVNDRAIKIFSVNGQLIMKDGKKLYRVDLESHEKEEIATAGSGQLDIIGLP